MLFAIRDDDTSFFTKPGELESAYDFVTEGTVSLSVVPFAVPHHEKGVLPCGEGIPFGFVSMAKTRGQYLMIPTAALNAFTARNIVIACHENNLDEANCTFPRPSMATASFRPSCLPSPWLGYSFWTRSFTSHRS